MSAPGQTYFKAIAPPADQGGVYYIQISSQARTAGEYSLRVD
jgi:hypothetical protein